MKDLIIVGIGGFFGSIARYGIAIASAKHFSDKLVTGTLLVNLLGCLIIGILAGYFGKMNQQLTIFLMAGFCGGFTTYSTFALDGVKLIKTGMYTEFFLYVIASTLGGILLCFLGFFIAEKLRY